ncbi:hypothetical protein AKJ65_01870 [candidate division MSBL1 archaeon SCGC-AAA259E19]|uniref:histidine kinase n=1 Tax=candidate division MSBL1 archaeon SCGC-AAA259E19 TaxID=1698264 RepID=A0A133UME2_9EURY|nr:hypothetical protein AKJ65_01870 [candidate division MSBL1 archaeon SCGC-AAA259E19]
MREDLRENGHEEIIGKTDIDLYPEKGRKTYEEDMHVMETEEPIINKEYSVEDSEGDKSYYSTSKAPVYDNDNNVIGLVGITQEITERKQLQERLDFESSLLNDLLENVPASIYFKDAECRFVEVSDFKAEELGMDRAEVVGKTDFDFYSEDRAQEMFEDDKRVMEEEEPVVNKEEKIVTPDGEEWWASVIKVPRYDEDGNVIGTLGISMDITERKQGEQREDFLHSLLSNDIETKNKTAVGILELLKERDISEQEKSMIDTAINSIEDSSELISRVWTLRKASRKTELSEVDLDSKINSAVESNAELLEEKEIDTEIGETEDEVKGGRLTEDLFSNLIEWIVRFGECNVLRVLAREENGRITIILEGDGQEVPEMIRRGITKDFREGQVKEGGMLIYLASTISTAYKGKFEIKESELG